MPLWLEGQTKKQQRHFFKSEAFSRIRGNIFFASAIRGWKKEHLEDPGWLSCHSSWQGAESAVPCSKVLCIEVNYYAFGAKATVAMQRTMCCGPVIGWAHGPWQAATGWLSFLLYFPSLSGCGATLCHCVKGRQFDCTVAGCRSGSPRS